MPRHLTILPIVLAASCRAPTSERSETLAGDPSTGSEVAQEAALPQDSVASIRLWTDPLGHFAVAFPSDPRLMWDRPVTNASGPGRWISYGFVDGDNNAYHVSVVEMATPASGSPNESKIRAAIDDARNNGLREMRAISIAEVEIERDGVLGKEISFRAKLETGDAVEGIMQTFLRPSPLTAYTLICFSPKGADPSRQRRFVDSLQLKMKQR